MKIRVITVGKLKKGYMLEGVNDYLGRVKHYIGIEIVETSESAIAKFLTDRTFNVILDRSGKEFDSLDFAVFIQDKLAKSSKDIVFFIGGANGFINELLEQGDLLLSISKMTFPHEVVRLLLLEQIYRAFTIINGEKYHK